MYSRTGSTRRLPASWTVLRKQQRRIPVRVEPVVIFNGMRICRLHPIQPHQRRYQHEQRRARQMEVGEQAVDSLEAVAGGDEDRGVAFEGADDAVFPASAFDQA